MAAGGFSGFDSSTLRQIEQVRHFEEVFELELNGVCFPHAGSGGQVEAGEADAAEEERLRRARQQQQVRGWRQNQGSLGFAEGWHSRLRDTTVSQNPTISAQGV